eukprot:5394667-Pyramimonas_sp.AAC.1
MEARASAGRANSTDEAAAAYRYRSTLKPAATAHARRREERLQWQYKSAALEPHRQAGARFNPAAA